MEASHKNFQVIGKNVHTFDGKNAADFIECYEKIRISLNINDKAAFRVLQGAPVSSAATATDGSRLAAWNTANENLYNVLFFTTKDAACSVVRCFADKTLDEGSGHGQRAWAALRETFHGCSREALRVEPAKMNCARMSPGQDPDEFLCELDTCRERLNACDPPKGPTGRQFEDIVLQALPLEYARIRDAEAVPSKVAYTRSNAQPSCSGVGESDCVLQGGHDRLTPSYIVTLTDAPTIFKVGLQGLTTQSTMEAKLVAAALAMKDEAVFFPNMMLELDFDKSFGSVPLHIDNTSVLYIAGNYTYIPRAKHIALRYFFSCKNWWRARSASTTSRSRVSW